MTNLFGDTLDVRVVSLPTSLFETVMTVLSIGVMVAQLVVAIMWFRSSNKRSRGVESVVSNVIAVANEFMDGVNRGLGELVRLVSKGNVLD